jgi:hypothetical protein
LRRCVQLDMLREDSVTRTGQEEAITPFEQKRGGCLINAILLLRRDVADAVRALGNREELIHVDHPWPRVMIPLKNASLWLLVGSSAIRAVASVGRSSASSQTIQALTV